MAEKIYTFTDEELERMLKSGEMRLLTSPTPPEEKTAHEKALEKAKRLFGKDFEDVVTLEIGGKSGLELIEELRFKGIVTSFGAIDLLKSWEFITSPKPRKIEVIKTEIYNLGLRNGVKTEQIYQKANDLGLDLCPAEAGPYLRLKYTQQSPGSWYFVAMEPILNQYGLPCSFDLMCHVDGSLRFYTQSIYPKDDWAADNILAFTIKDS